MRMTGGNGPQSSSGNDDALAEVAKAVLPHVLAEKPQARQQQPRPTVASERKRLLIQRERARRVMAAAETRLQRLAPKPAAAAPAAPAANVAASPALRLSEDEPEDAMPTNASERLEQVRAWMEIGADPDRCAEIVVQDGDIETMQQIRIMQPAQMGKLLGAALGVSDPGDVSWVDEFARRCKAQHELASKQATEDLHLEGEEEFEEEPDGDEDDQRDQT